MKVLTYGKAFAATLALTCVACATPPDIAASPKASLEHVTAPALAALKNMDYAGLGELPEPISLKGGRWSGLPALPGAATRDFVALDDTLRVVGDLDGDGRDEAVVLLTHSPGGTAAWVYLAVVKREGGKLRHMATVALGDRVQIRSLQIDGGVLLASIVRAGPNDAACCPGEVANLTWTLSEGRLKALTEIATGRLSLDTLAGTTWVLRAWNIDEPAPLQPVVTLAYASGRFMGGSGCNRYTAGVTPGDRPGEARVGLAASTRMACPEDQTAVEARFLERLQAARYFGFRSGRLAISAPDSNRPGTTLLFEASNPVTPP